jgi:hypothetical protein
LWIGLALFLDALLEFRLRGELRFLHDLRAHLVAGLVLDLVAQQVFHLAADALLDLFLELLLHRGFGLRRLRGLFLRRKVGFDTLLGERGCFRLGLGARFGKELRLALGPHAHLGELALLFLFLRLLLGGELRGLRRGRGLARRFLAHLRFQLDPGTLRGFLGTLRLLHRHAFGLGFGPWLPPRASRATPLRPSPARAPAPAPAPPRRWRLFAPRPAFPAGARAR